jgi:flagellar L-ring protein precursor FlgH
MKSAVTLSAAVLALLAGCATSYDRTITQGPLVVAPLPRPANVERINNGAIFQANSTSGYLFSTDKKPRNIGDTLKVDIAESLSASSKVNTDTSRDSKLASKGPGGSTGSGLLTSLMNIDATASGSNSFKGDGSTESTSKFTGQLAVSVINVLPNGNLVIAGDRSISMNGGIKTLRFSGIVDPKDIRVGNVVASADTVNARMEIVGKGDVSDAGSRSWLQRVLAESLSVW